MNITFKDKAGIFFWRNMMMPLIAVTGDKKYPSGKVKEFAYGNLKDEKLDFIVPNIGSKNRLAIVHIHGGAWIAGSKGDFYSKVKAVFLNCVY
jgi:acetyl esterase/lipase